VGYDKVAVLIVILAIAAIVAISFLRRSSVKTARSRPISSTASRVDTARQVRPSVAPRSQQPPAELAAFSFIGSDTLAAERLEVLREDLRKLPRPPLSLHKLVSPELLDSATSGQISDLITSEALITAQVLARVNSPFYGMRRPVVSIGQAITFLGLNSVRGICLQYMLEASVRSSSPERKKVIDVVSSASALAGELCFRLAQRLELPAQGSLVTQVVLSFLGHLAAASLQPLDSILWSPGNGLLERASAEQLRLGLSATEIGSLLMQEWGLPTSLIVQVGEIDRMLVTPLDQVEPGRGARLALCFLCARLGERLALGSLSDLATFDLANDSSTEFFHIRAHLDSPRLARLAEFLQSAELVKKVRQMQGAFLARD
jgi:HD-like signal output (HDOD) protein